MRIRELTRVRLMLMFTLMVLIGQVGGIIMLAQDSTCDQFLPLGSAVTGLDGQATMLHNEGIAAWDNQEFDLAISHFENALEVHRELLGNLQAINVDFGTDSQVGGSTFDMVDVYEDAIDSYESFVASMSLAAEAHSDGNAALAGNFVTSANDEFNDFVVSYQLFTSTFISVSSTFCPMDGLGQSEDLQLVSLQPAEGSAGEIITITGTGLDSQSSALLVTVGGRPASILSASGNAIVAAVPRLLPDGVQAVQVTSGGIASNELNYTVNSALAPEPIDAEDISAGFMIRQILIFLSPSVGELDQDVLKAEFGFVELQQFPLLGMLRGLLPEGTRQAETLDVLARLNADPRVDQAFLNQLTEPLQAIPSEIGGQDQQPVAGEGQDQQWLGQLGFQNVDAYFPNRAAGIIIAIIDSGIDLNAESVRQEIALLASSPQGMNMAGDRDTLTQALDRLGHGTAVASIVAARDMNAINGGGVATRAEIIAMRVFQQTVNADGKIEKLGNLLWIARALAMAYLQGADVINMSLETRGRVETAEFYERVINNVENFFTAIGQEIPSPVLVAATGNQREENGSFEIGCPACLDRVIAVGSIGMNGAGIWIRSEFSRWGPEIDFVASGENITTTLLGGAFGSPGDGTSFAAPQVAGLAALILGENPELSSREVRSIILNCFVLDIDETGFDEQTGWGRIAMPKPDNRPASCSASGTASSELNP